MGDYFYFHETAFAKFYSDRDTFYSLFHGIPGAVAGLPPRLEAVGPAAGVAFRGVIISIAPFFTAIFNWLFLAGKMPRFRFFAGFILAMAGICLISYNSGTVLSINPLGDILAVAAAVIWAAYSSLTKKISALGYGTIQTTRRTFFYGLLFMAPILYLMDLHNMITRFTDMKNLANLLFLGVGASALCFVTWNTGVRILGSVKTSVYIYMVPVITTLTSALVLKEVITAPAILGIIMTLAGLLLSEQRMKDHKTKDHKLKDHKTKNKGKGVIERWTMKM